MAGRKVGGGDKYIVLKVTCAFRQHYYWFTQNWAKRHLVTVLGMTIARGLILTGWFIFIKKKIL